MSQNYCKKANRTRKKAINIVCRAAQVKVHPVTGHGDPEEYRHSSTLSSTSALYGGWVVNATSR
jgi:hypothetical protein